MADLPRERNPRWPLGSRPDKEFRDFLAAREIARAAETGELERDVETALEDLAEIRDYLVEAVRRPGRLVELQVS
jgi:hypothetical protein